LDWNRKNHETVTFRWWLKLVNVNSSLTAGTWPLALLFRNEIRDPPDLQPLVGIDPAGVMAPLVDGAQRLGKPERRAFEIQGAPRTCLDVLVLGMIGERGGHEVRGSATLDILKAATDVSEAKVNEAISAEDSIGIRDPISGKIESDEADARRAI
jgi:hypothetical protein